MNKQAFAPGDDDMVTLHHTGGKKGDSGITRIPRAEYEEQRRLADEEAQKERARKLAEYDAWEELKEYLNPGETVGAVNIGGVLMSPRRARREMRGKSLFMDNEFVVPMTIWTDQSIIEVFEDYERGFQIRKLSREPT